MTEPRPVAVPAPETALPAADAAAPLPADAPAPLPADAPAASTRSGVPADAPNADIVAMTFDKALAELQAVVGRLEAGGLALEDSIGLYERGVALHDHCTRLLSSAELRVQRLVEQAGGKLRAVDLSVDDEA